MTVKDLRDKLANIADDQEVVLVDEDRLGHDDAIRGFSIKPGFRSDDPNYSVLLNGEATTEYDEDEEPPSYTIPCCCIVIQ